MATRCVSALQPGTGGIEGLARQAQSRTKSSADRLGETAGSAKEKLGEAAGSAKEKLEEGASTAKVAWGPRARDCQRKYDVWRWEAAGMHA